MKIENEVPRRAKMSLWCPAEVAIFQASTAVDKMGADPRLTEALNLLHRARHVVANYIDKVDTTGGGMILSEEAPYPRT